MAIYAAIIGDTECFLLSAENEDEAMRTVIAYRISTANQSIDDAVGWYRKHDTILGPINQVINIQPYRGDIPDTRDEHQYCRRDLR